MDEKTTYQTGRFLQKIAEKYPPTEEPTVFTDIHIRVSQDTGDVTAFNDDERELTRCVVEEWIDFKGDSEQFYNMAIKAFRPLIPQYCDDLGVIRPYNFVLETGDGEHVAELYVADDETVILGTPFMQNLSEELDAFLDDLMKE